MVCYVTDATREDDVVIADVLRQAHGGELIARLAHAHQISVEDADAVVASAVAELSQFLERNTLSNGGLGDLIGAIGHGHHEAYFDNPAFIGDARMIADGNAILGHITGSKDRSRGIADRVERATGVEAAIVRDMLPSIAGLTMGALSKHLKGGLGEIAQRAGGGFLPKQPMPPGRPYDPRDNPTTDMDTSRLPGGRSTAGTGGWGPQSDAGDVKMNPGGGLQMPDSLPPLGEPGQRGGYEQPRGNPGEPLPMPGNRVPQVPGNADNPFGDLAEILRRGLGLPGGNGGPIIIPLPGGGSFPFPMPGGGQGGGRPMPRGETGSGGGFPWPQSGGSQGGGGLPMPDGGNPGGGGAFPWPQGGGQQSPLPMPGGGGQGGGGLPFPKPGGNGRGIELPGGQVGGSMLWNIIRSILGSALGFQSKGIMSWIIRYVIMKYGWGILRTVLGRGLGR
jgi:hypothetical protein